MTTPSPTMTDVSLERSHPDGKGTDFLPSETDRERGRPSFVVLASGECKPAEPRIADPPNEEERDMKDTMRKIKVRSSWVDMGALTAILVLVILVGLRPLWTPSGEEFESVLSSSMGSVCLVMVTSGGETPGSAAIATAFVVAKGILATNAHVAEIFHQLENGMTMTVRSGSDPSRVISVDRVEVHPGWDAFQAVWDEYLPACMSVEGTLDPVERMQGCDVALLYVDDDGGLGRPLPLAAKATLDDLQPGAPVGYIGFPLEGQAMGGGAVVNSSPKCLTGHIIAMTDFFMAQRESGDRCLIHHDLPATPGASGSPLLNRHGEVIGILNAVSVEYRSEGITAPGFNFAQRSDLLEEMLDNSALTNQVERNETWRREIAIFPSLASISRDEVLSRLPLAEGEDARQVFQQSGVLTCESGDSEDYTFWSYTSFGQKALFTAPATGTYLVMAYTEGGGDIDLGITDEEFSTLLDMDEGFLPAAGVVVDLEKHETIGIQVSSYDGEREYTLEVLTPDSTF